ncbi:MAG: TatD family hydrolase [Eubacterium sp.]|nr:TatD family hydrolase [Eubacterium sp.]
MIFDTHAHYDDSKFDEDRDELLASLAEAGVGTVVNVGCDIQSSQNSLDLSRKYDFIYAALGVHPSDIACLNEETFGWLRSHLHDDKVVALGEIGLDFYWEKDEAVRDKQRYWFRRQFELAKEEGMSVIIHSREAAQETYEMLKEMMAGSDVPVVVHCYSYSPEMAADFIKLGCHIGIGGVVTFKKAKKLKEVAKDIPMDRLLLETDCPYLAPEPFRGRRNNSALIAHVVDEIAGLRGISREEIIEKTEENARKFYGIA